MIEAIGGWVEALPSEYLNDTHLKYLAWALSDRSPVVRLMAIRALTTLYTNRCARMLGVCTQFRQHLGLFSVCVCVGLLGVGWGSTSHCDV